MKTKKNFIKPSSNAELTNTASPKINPIDTSYGSGPTENVASVNNNGIPSPMQIENLTLPIERSIEGFNYKSKS